MLLNCTRLSQSWSSIRISQLRTFATHSTRRQYLGYLNVLQPKRAFSEPLIITLARRGLHITRSKNSMFSQRQISVSGRWAGKQFTRLRYRDSSGSGHSRPAKVKIKKSDLLKLLSLAKSEKYVLIVAMICLLVSSSITMSVPFALGKIIDIIFNKDGPSQTSMHNLLMFSMILVCVFILGGLANFLRVYLFNSASLRIVRNLRSRVYHKMLIQEANWFDTKGSGELINRLVNDTFFVGNSLSQNLSDGVRSLAMISSSTAMMIYTSPHLALVGTIVVPSMAGVAIVYGRYVKNITRELLDKFASISKYAEERFSNVKTVKTFCREKEESEAYDKLLHDAMSLGYKDVHAKSIFFGLTGFSGNLIIISVLYYGGTLVLENSLTIGTLTSFLLYAGYVAISMSGLSNFYSELNKGIGASQRIWEILNREYAIPINVGIVPSAKPLGEISFENIIYNFPSRPDSKVLKNFTLKLLPGQTTAIVGRSGSGKTTICGLLLRLYDPQEGVVKLDSTDIRLLNPLWLRSNISAVSQEPVLFSGTIRENILYGLNPGDSVSEELLQEIVRESHIDEFASQLSDGLETIVGQRGMMLSGGQKQRVAIARALIRNPKILILDEATSALDSVSEQLVHTALDRMVQGRTVLKIAHRLSTIRNADKIAVLDNGQIVEEGTYESLMSNNEGAFRELVAKQAFISEVS